MSYVPYEDDANHTSPAEAQKPAVTVGTCALLASPTVSEWLQEAIPTRPWSDSLLLRQSRLRFQVGRRWRRARMSRHPLRPRRIESMDLWF